MDSIDYYEQHAREYYDKTKDLNLEPVLQRFTVMIPDGSAILDLGCGSGRDSLYFIENGYDVTSIDGSAKMCGLATVHIGEEAFCMKFNEIEFEDVFDGVWACDSLVHVPVDEMYEIINKITNSMKPDGILFMSFHYGDFEGIRNERYYADYNSKKIKEVLSGHKNLTIIDIFKTEEFDKQEKEYKIWLNILARKDGGELDE